MKKRYVTPCVEMLKMENVKLFATSMTSTDAGIGFGGNASDHGIVDADVNEGGNWDIW